MHRECGLAPSTALRLLRTLETTGFVSREERVGTYRPGARLIQLGAQALSNESLVDLAKPTMEKLVAETGESAYLSRRRPRAPPRCTSASSRAPTPSGTPAGSAGRFPSNKSAAGRALRGRVPDDGYVVVERGVEADVTAIASPVYSQARIVAAMSLVIPSYRLTKSQIAECGRLLTVATGEVSAQLSRSSKSTLSEGES